MILSLLFFFALSYIGESQQKFTTQKNFRKIKRPDLVVSIRAPQRMTETVHISQRIQIRVGNAGDAAAGPFVVDVKITQGGGKAGQLGSKVQLARNLISILGGTIPINGLNVGQQLNLMPDKTVKLPGHLPAGFYTIKVDVDSKKAVNEKIETNNIATAVFWLGPKITDVSQSFSWMVAPMNELTVDGQGFGPSAGSKILKMGPYTLSVGNGCWHNNEIWCNYPGGVPHGEHYMVRLLEGNNVISNEFDFFLKMILFKINFNPIQGPAGTSLHVDGMMMGASQGQKVLKFGNTAVQVQSWNDASIQCTVPNLPPGTYNVFIDRNGVVLSNIVTYTITSGPEQ